jgi:hypothetical protein
MYKCLMVTISLLLISNMAEAKCYSLAEAEAEQAIRIHSELMVIGLNCQHLGPKGRKNLYIQYKDFTNKHGALLRGYENTLLNYFRQAGKSNPDREMHTMRTNFANKISRDVATMRPDAFCAYYAPRMPRAAAMNDGQVQTWAATFYPNFPVSQPLCKQ